MKGKLISVLVSASFVFSAHAVSAAVLGDHRGTSLSGFEIGTKPITAAVKKYNTLFKQAGDQYGVDPNVLAAVCMQESGGVNYSYREDGTEYPAWGIMQIEYTHEHAFARFGLDREGIEWTLNDRLDPAKAIPYAAYLLSESLYDYDDDYIKMIQAYNFGQTVLDKIIEAKGDDWLSERANAKSYIADWEYPSYGDPQYAEHVLVYYHDDIEYIGAKVRVNGKLVKFSDQYPIVIDGTTLIPVRAVGETLGADVEWDDKNKRVLIDKNGREIELYIGGAGYIDGVQYQLSRSAEVINGRTLIPLRFTAEAFDIEVEWNGTERTVEMTAPRALLN